ncbi:RICIN domain-containing protein [Streptomyces sp. IB2014 016-6]|uniref:RICIN domain-containing protein n=1 Tax=Streptomyces sp. IB2014 016-6 TaxID=2517818 RepID=UPI00164FCAA5|nr:RICIN domain-containing protein [Streptomyces sp. IB2014 016-6]
MNRGDEAADPGPEPPAHFSVVISGDGSAAIDGDPVAMMPGEPLDVAILDMLHGYARGLNAPVTGAISDPSAEYVAIVQVAPDGSSKLLEQRANDADEAGEEAPVAAGGPGERAGQQREPVEPFGSGNPRPEPEPETEAPGTGHEAKASALPEPPVRPRSTPPPALRAVPDKKSARPSVQSQSDEEYEGPGLFQRPLFIGGVAAVIAVLVVGSLVALGSGGGAGGSEGKNQAAGSGQETSSSPMTFRPPGYSPPTTPWPSVSASPSVTKSPSPSPSSSKTKPASPKPKPKPAEPEPEPKPKPRATGPSFPTGPVLIKNEKFGTCVDLPGRGEGKQHGRVQDARPCDPTSADNQQWTLKRTHKGRGTGGADLYLIRNVKDGRCLDLYGEGPAPVSTRVGEYTCKATLADNMLWWFHKRPNGTYWVRNQMSGDMCLDISRHEKEKPANAGLTIYPCDDRDDHQWRFVKS